MPTSRQERLLTIATGLMAGAALFALLCAALLIQSQAGGKVDGLVHSAHFAVLRDGLKADPKNEALRQEIRALDVAVREDLFRQLSRSRRSAWGLLIGAVVFVSAAQLRRVQRRQAPDPSTWGAQCEEDERSDRVQARKAIFGGFCMAGGLAAGLALYPVDLPLQDDTPTPAAPSYATMAQMAHEWPVFRGPGGDGRAPNAEARPGWQLEADQGLVWQVEVPLPGNSSPVLWGDRLFLTGANAEENRVFAFDTATGQLCWSATVQIRAGPRPGAVEVMDDTGYAAPSAASDGRRVYAIFANGNVAAFDFAGKQVWSQNLGPLPSAYGYASSPTLYRDRLLLQLDVQEGARSRLLALDTKTGVPVWETARMQEPSWASPIVCEVDGRAMVIAAAAPDLVAYDPADGSERWRADVLLGEVASTPLLAGAQIVVCAPWERSAAVRLDGSGDVTETHLTWQTDLAAPDATSPVHDGSRVYFLESEGHLTCHALSDGSLLWETELGGSFYASPAIAGDVLVAIDRRGKVHYLATGDHFDSLGTGSFGEPVVTSPAFRGRRMFVRGSRHLFCIESPEAGGG